MTKKDIIMAKIAELLELMEADEDEVDIVASLPKMTKEELVRYFVINYKDEFNEVDLSYLNFSMFAGTHVNLSNMKVQGDLITAGAKVGGELMQDRQEAETITQSGCKAVTCIYQAYQQAGGTIFQEDNKSGNTIRQDLQEAPIIYQHGHEAEVVVQNRLDQVKAYREQLVETPGYIFKPKHMTKAACYSYTLINDTEQEQD